MNERRRHGACNQPPTAAPHAAACTAVRGCRHAGQAEGRLQPHTQGPKKAPTKPARNVAAAGHSPVLRLLPTRGTLICLLPAAAAALCKCALKRIEAVSQQAGQRWVGRCQSCLHATLLLCGRSCRQKVGHLAKVQMRALQHFNGCCHILLAGRLAVAGSAETCWWDSQLQRRGDERLQRKQG